MAIAWLAATVAVAGAAPGAPPAAGSAAASRTGQPAVHARAAIAIDSSTGDVLFADNADARLPIASTTKLMTALLTLEHAGPSTSFAAPHYVGVPAEVLINLAPGERMTVHDLLRALLLPSANDAAMTLADGVGGSESRFVAEMNQRAQSLGLTETHYANPIGLDAPGNYSSARDLARLAALLLRNPAFASIVDLPSARLTSGSHPRVVVNRNDLIGRYPFVTGVKTGHTIQAGDVLVASGRAHGAEVVSAVLGEQSVSDQDADSLALLRYGLAQLETVHPVRAGAVIVRPRVEYFGGERVSLVAARGVTVVARRGVPVTTHVAAPKQLRGPLRRGARVGAVVVSYEGRKLQTVPLVTASPVRGAGWLRRLTASPGYLLAALACLLLVGATWVVWRRRHHAGPARRRVVSDHHRYAQRGNRQDARGAELPTGAAAPGGRADRDGGR